MLLNQDLVVLSRGEDRRIRQGLLGSQVRCRIDPDVEAYSILCHVREIFAFLSLLHPGDLNPLQ